MTKVNNDTTQALIEKLELRRKKLNKIAEKEFLATGKLTGILACEEQTKFEESLHEYEHLLSDDDDIH